MQTCDFQNSHQTPSIQTSAVDTYASYLKSVYTREKLQVHDKWPLVKSKKYINLALIEKENMTKPEADQFTRDTIHGNIDDIRKSKVKQQTLAKLPSCQMGHSQKCILVEGAPGVGKSTFTWKLCCKCMGERKVAPTVPAGCSPEASRQQRASYKEHLRPLQIL